MFKNIISSFFIVVLMTACSQNAGRDGRISKADGGAVVGAIAGALAGHTIGKGKGNVAAIAIGTLAGAYVGNQIGQSLDRADLAYLNRTTQSTLETAKVGVTKKWVNPDTGNQGTVTVNKTYEASPNVYCREFTQTISIGGKSEQAYGKACRQPDDTWKIQ